MGRDERVGREKRIAIEDKEREVTEEEKRVEKFCAVVSVV